MRIGLVLFTVGCSTSPADHMLPSARLTPHLDSATSTIACGEDVAWNGDATPDERFGFTYDGNGFLTHADGAFAAGGTNESIDYSYDAAGDFTHMVDSNGFGGSSSEITADYDATNGLVDYAWSYAAPGYADSWTYAMSSFLGPWQPQREVITEQGQPGFGYTLAYDSDGRLVTATPDTGPATTYAYDDQALTITIDTGSGAFHGVIAYDTDFRELSEVWGGSDPNAVASSTVFDWSGDQLNGITYSSGTPLAVVEVDTVRYQCGAARAGKTTRWIGPHTPRAVRR
jgi:YD repeat-containing protein